MIDHDVPLAMIAGESRVASEKSMEEGDDEKPMEIMGAPDQFLDDADY
jgi:hypothetical protein